MQPLDFVLVVVPLTIIVATLTGLIYYLARKEEFEEHRQTVAVQKFLAVRSKQQSLIRKELENLQSQHESGIIDDTSYERLQNVLSMTQEKMRYEAYTLLNKKDGVLARARLSVEEVLLEPEPDTSLEPETNRGEQEVCEDKPKKHEKAKPQMKRKAKRKQVRKRKTGIEKNLQMGIVVDEDNTLLEPDEKAQQKL